MSQPAAQPRGHIGAHVVDAGAAYIAPSAQLFGKVYLGAESSVWPNVVMRAEVHEIRIGARSNVQDFVMIHVGYRTPTLVGEDCSVTHHATLHGCAIGDRCLIGINATLMDGARIGSDCIVAGHCILTEGQEFPDRAVIAGVPARQVATRDSGEPNRANAEFYRRNAHNYARGIERMDEAEFRAVLGLD